MKYLRVLCLLLLTALLCASSVLAQETSAVSPVIGENGLLLYLPEEYLGSLPNCSDLFFGKNTYLFYYDDCGMKVSSSVGNDRNWELFVRYVGALIDSGYYELSSHNQGVSTETYALKYTGPSSVSATITNYTDENGSVIEIWSHHGDVSFTVSRDITIHNLEAVIERMKYPPQKCSRCSGKGSIVCIYCAGSGVISRTTGKERCFRCQGLGKTLCTSCNGSGKM
ncbi:MAG: hypothetical protein IKU34_08275 [Clostridia bacterium]|nr:hypothetical protein [Clostridia bacterium]